MAEDAIHDDEADATAGAPQVPKPRRQPEVIEGEAIDITAPQSAPQEGSPLDAAAHEATPAAPEPAAEAESQAPGREAAPPAAAAETVAEARAPETVVEESAPAAAPAAAAAAATRPRRSYAFLWGFAGALIGAGVALGGFYVYDPRAGATRDLESRIGALDAAAKDEAAQSQTLGTRLAALEARPAPAADKLAGLEARLAALEARPAPTAGQPAGLDALEARLAALEARPAPAAAAGEPTGLDAIEARLAKLESSAVSPQTIAALQADVSAARAAADKAAAGAGAPAPSGPDPEIAKLASDEGALSERIGKLEAALAAPKSETRAPVVTPPAGGDPAAAAVAALALQQRFAAGRPFGVEFAALTGADAGALAALKPYAESGAPTAATLASAFAKIAPGLAGPSPVAAGGVMDRMLEHMSSLVRVKPIGEVAGDDPAALVSQMSAALARGDVTAALAIRAKLPEAARNESAVWAKDADGFLAAAAAADSLTENAFRRLADAKN